MRITLSSGAVPVRRVQAFYPGRRYSTGKWRDTLTLTELQARQKGEPADKRLSGHRFRK